MDLDVSQFVRSTTLLVVLLNPFLMSIYLLDLIKSLDQGVFSSVLVRGSVLATLVFWGFAVGGDAVFSQVFQVRFASFLIFGGVLFVLIALKFAQSGPDSLSQLRGKPEHIAGSIAMPFMVGPATVSASVITGATLPLVWALAAIGSAMLLTVLGLLALKRLHGWVQARNETLVERYIDIVGRASALLIGSIAVDMIINGFELWWNARTL